MYLNSGQVWLCGHFLPRFRRSEMLRRLRQCLVRAVWTLHTENAQPGLPGGWPGPQWVVKTKGRRRRYRRSEPAGASWAAVPPELSVPKPPFGRAAGFWDQHLCGKQGINTYKHQVLEWPDRLPITKPYPRYTWVCCSQSMPIHSIPAPSSVYSINDFFGTKKNHQVTKSVISHVSHIFSHVISNSIIHHPPTVLVPASVGMRVPHRSALAVLGVAGALGVVLCVRADAVGVGHFLAMGPQKWLVCQLVDGYLVNSDLKYLLYDCYVFLDVCSDFYKL